MLNLSLMFLKKVLLLIALLSMQSLFAQDSATLNWAKDNAQSLETLGHAAIEKLASEAGVLGFGEGDHGLHEQTDERIALTKFLVEKMGYRLVFMESGFIEGFLVNQFVQGEIQDYQDVVEGFTHNMGAWQEQKELMVWLRDWNIKNPNDRVAFYGLDEPVTGTSLYGVFEQIDPELKPFLTNRRFKKHYENVKSLALKGNRLFKKVEEIYRSRGAAVEPDYIDAIIYFSLSELNSKEQNKLFHEIEKLLKFSKKLMSPLLYRKIHQLQLITNSLKLRLEKPWNPYNKFVANFLGIEYQEPDLSDPQVSFSYWQGYQDTRAGRERLLLDNILWLTKHFNQKGVVFAHNGHLQKTPTNGGAMGTSIGLGSLLSETLGSKYKVIATTMNYFITDDGGIATEWHGQPVLDVENNPDTIEYYLIRTNCNGVCYFLLDQVPPFLEQPIKMRFATNLFEANLALDYDALLYFPTVTHGHPL